MLLPILLLAAAGFTILTTEFVIVGLLPALAADLQVSVAQAGLLVSLFAFSVAAFGPFLTAALAGVEPSGCSSPACCCSPRPMRWPP